MALQINDLIDGKYQIVRLLGEGGMGSVYEGLNTRIHRKVAIKVLHANVASSTEAVERFEREAQAAGRIGSRHIVEVLDLGDLPGGDRYMVMEFLDGESLADRIRSRGGLTPQQLYPIAVQLLEGLAAAHAAGIVHRDLKPENIYLMPPTSEEETDFVKILDFGVSKFNAAAAGKFSMTRTGSVMGTPYYMSPEQAKGVRELDQRTDLYAVGVILYEGLSGCVPFEAETFNELLFKIALEEPTPLSDIVMDVNPAFAQIISKAMARDPNQRFQTASDFKAALVLWSQRNSVAPLGLFDPTHEFGTRRPAGTVMGGTAGAWTSTGAPPAPEAEPAKRRWPRAVAAVTAVALVIGAVGFKVVTDKHQNTAAAARAAIEKADLAKEAAERLAAAQQAQREQEAREQEARRTAEEAARVQLIQNARKVDEEPQEDRKKEATTAPVSPPRVRISAAMTASTAVGTASAAPAPVSPGPSPPPAAAPNPKKEPANGGATTSTGRAIRSTL
jgi:serine/threonine-protein kinase